MCTYPFCAVLRAYDRIFRFGVSGLPYFRYTLPRVRHDESVALSFLRRSDEGFRLSSDVFRRAYSGFLLDFVHNKTET